MKNQKIKAFTIMEVTVTMLISALVVMIAYSALQTASGYYRSFHLKKESAERLLQLNYLIRRDFTKAEIITRDSMGVSFFYDKQDIHYEFPGGFVVRVTTVPDTFRIGADSLRTYFEDKEIIEGRLPGDSSLIDRMDLYLLSGNTKIHYFYHKAYSSTNLFNRDPNAVN